MRYNVLVTCTAKSTDFTVLWYFTRGTLVPTEHSQIWCALSCYTADMDEQKDTNAVSFVATVAKVQTLADSGLRVWLDLAEHELIPAAWLMDCQRRGVVLRVVVRADETK